MNTVQRTTANIMNRYETARMEVHADIGQKMTDLRKQFEEQMAALKAEEAKRLAEAKAVKNRMLVQLWSANPIDFDTEDEE
jgi:hypothetical protein